MAYHFKCHILSVSDLHYNAEEWSGAAVCILMLLG